jgi:hypothetical protein
MKLTDFGEWSQVFATAEACASPGGFSFGGKEEVVLHRKKHGARHTVALVCWKNGDPIDVMWPPASLR